MMSATVSLGFGSNDCAQQLGSAWLQHQYPQNCSDTDWWHQHTPECPSIVRAMVPICHCSPRAVCCPAGGFASRDTAIRAGQHRQLWQGQACASAQCVLCGEPLSRCAACSAAGKATVAHVDCYELLRMLRSQCTSLATPEQMSCCLTHGFKLKNVQLGNEETGYAAVKLTASLALVQLARWYAQRISSTKPSCLIALAAHGAMRANIPASE